MEFIADLHIHSRYSRATSEEMVIPEISRWAQRKGIRLVGAGDMTHPKWLDHLKAELVPAGGDLYKHKDTYFILNTEVSNIYSKFGKLRKIHALIFVPTFDDAKKVTRIVEKYGKIESDGRPMLGLDVADMTGAIRNACPRSFIVPAHIWTPWFSLFGAKSGFDTIEDCFGPLAKEIHALETGLSSDPAMNWRLSALDRFSLISNSDAHSPSKLGREANVFDCDLAYDEIIDVLKKKDGRRFKYTIEFFPEEGKYHYDGHRKCSVRVSPSESKMNEDLCPVCGKPVTIGVLHRVEDLADRNEGFVPENAIPYRSLVPLEEVIAASLGVGTGTAAVTKEYDRLVASFKSEFDVLLNVPVEDIAAASSEKTADAVRKVREGKVKVIPGYDGEFGEIELVEGQECRAEDSQMTLF
jgi:uncharacterized protein (TIGR00375 family)